MFLTNCDEKKKLKTISSTTHANMNILYKFPEIIIKINYFYQSNFQSQKNFLGKKYLLHF